MRLAALLVLSLAGVALAGCSQAPDEDLRTDRSFAVWGAPDAVARFTFLQKSRRPALKASDPQSIGANKERVIFEMPATYSGQELVRTTREALAAGLSYAFEQRTGTARAHRTA